MDLLKRNKYVAGIIISLAYSVLILPVTEATWFDISWLKHDQLIFSVIVKLLFFVVLTTASIGTLRFIEKVRAGDALYRTWLKYTLLYAGLMAVILILIWPGYWQWDEIDVLHAIRHYDAWSWQSMYTQLFYIFCLYLIPFATGITIIQLIIISLIIGYILANIKRLTTHKLVPYIIAAPFVLSPVIILSNFYTLRSQLIGYLILLLLFKIFLLFKEGTANKYTAFIGFTVLISLIGMWRSENIIYLSLVPILWIYFGFYKLSRASWQATIGVSIFALIAIGGFFAMSRYIVDVSYTTTVNLNTLQMMVHDNLRGDVSKNIKSINRVLDVDILKKYPSYCDIDSFWMAKRDYGRPLLRPGWQQEDKLNDYRKSVTRLFIDNLDLFLKRRLDAYLATNYMNDAPLRCHMSVNTGQFITNHSGESPHTNPLAQFFAKTNHLGAPLNPELRTTLLRSLALTDIQWGRPFVWNVTPILALCLAVALHAALKRRYFWILAMSLLFLHTALVFLSAPATIFMYYFPPYLAGLVLSLMYIFLHLDAWLTARKKASERDIINSMIDSEKKKVLIAIPAYNCAPQITRVLGNIDERLQKRVAEVAVIDNGSTDNTIERALEFKQTSDYKKKLHIYRNNDNYNLGGTHKVAFTKAEKENFTHVIILHGDNQAKASEANDLLDFAENNPQQTVLGSRFNKNSRLHGYDKKRIYGNKVLNAIYSTLTLRKLEDLGSGLNLFYMKDLDKKTYLKFADKLTFNYELILDLVKRNVNFAYLPISWSEDDQVSNARNVNIFKTALANVIRWRINMPVENEVRKVYECEEVKNG